MPPPSAKRRKLNNNNFRNNRVEEVTFDPAARQEYLTGFHKRKQQRIQNAKDAAMKREKEERVQERRQIREQRKEDLVRHVAEVNAELRKQNPDISDEELADEEDELDGDGEEHLGTADVAEPTPQDEEYVDEDKYTTVTVEAMDLANGHGEEQKAVAPPHVPPTDRGRRRSNDSTADRPKKKKKPKFRYETKAERQTARQKQKIKSKAAKARRKEG